MLTLGALAAAAFNQPAHLRTPHLRTPLTRAPPLAVVADDLEPLAQEVGGSTSFGDSAFVGAAAAPPRKVRADAVYEVLRQKYDRTKLTRFFLKRPFALMRRGWEFAAAYRRLVQIWEDDTKRGEQFRAEIASLGPVAVKLGQTLSQRPDIVDEDVCEALKTLQTANTPFPNEEAWGERSASPDSCTCRSPPHLSLRVRGRPPPTPLPPHSLFPPVAQGCSGTSSRGRGPSPPGWGTTARAARPSSRGSPRRR